MTEKISGLGVSRGGGGGVTGQIDTCINSMSFLGHHRISMCNLLLSVLMFVCCYKAIWIIVRLLILWILKSWKSYSPTVFAVTPHAIFLLPREFCSLKINPHGKNYAVGVVTEGCSILYIEVGKNSMGNSHQVALHFMATPFSGKCA